MRASAGRTLWLRERSHMYSQASEPVETGKGGGYSPSLSAYSPLILATMTSAIQGARWSDISSSMLATLLYVSRFVCCIVSRAR